MRDSELVVASHQEYVDMVIRLLEDQEYYRIKQNSVKEVSRRVTDLDGRAKDVGRQILLVLEPHIIGFNENSGTPLLKKIYDLEESNLPAPYVRSLAVDNNNHLWIARDIFRHMPS